MKKLLILTALCAITFNGTAQAYLRENSTASTETLERQGYSRATLELTDMHVSKTAGEAGKQRRFVNKKSGNIFGRAYERIKLYTDPGQDDGLFGEHEINFTNNWTGQTNTYTTRKKTQRRVDNL